MKASLEAFFTTTRIPSPCGTVRHDPGHALLGHPNDKGPVDALVAWDALSVEDRILLSMVLGNDFNSLAMRLRATGRWDSFEKSYGDTITARRAAEIHS